MKNILLSIIVILIILSNAFSQTRKERIKTARTQINSLLTSYNNSTFRTEDIVDVDSSIGVSKVADGNITNPYGTLNGCYLFIAKSEGENGKHLIGVYRNNQIVWTSKQLNDYGRDYGGLFMATKDFNNSGMVDIAIYFFDVISSENDSFFWMFGWDGNQGHCINTVSTDSITNIVATGSFKIMDVDGDGISEVVAFDHSDRVNTIYSWNGSLYGNWLSYTSLIGKTHTIANNLVTSVHAMVNKDGNAFQYSYTVNNAATSKQKLNSFLFYSPIDTIYNILFPSNWQGGQWSDYPLINCHTVKDTYRITAGATLHGFSFECQYLPVITNFYTQGPCYALEYASDLDTMRQNEYNNVLNNSYKGLTIGPNNPPSPFVSLNFLDTLSSYTTQSRALGWIKDDATAQKYLNYFTSAKTLLQAGNVDSVKSILKTVVSNTISDSTANISSEAYALLRYNAEYLRKSI